MSHRPGFHTLRLPRLAALAALLAFPVAAAAQGSPPLLPASPNDAAVERRVDSLVALLSPDEKLALLGGVNFFDVPGNPRIGLPQLGTADSPFGVRADGPSTVYPGGIGLAATWNDALAEQVGAEVGRDARARGKAYSLGPAVNIYRSPLNGRNFEYFGEDPWLASRTAVSFIRGLQAQGVSATIKHYLGNNSEYLRNTTDSRLDERTLREIYLPAFEAAVKEAGTGAIMPAYNLVNGAYMTANRRLLVDLAKNEWGFRGVMISDWGAVHSTLGAANGGTDLEMPGPAHFNRDSLLPLIKSGHVTQATIDDKVRRLVRNAVRFGWLDRPQLDPKAPRYNARGRDVALQGARESIVLLKNDRNVLPLDRAHSRTIAVIGPNAYPAVPLGGGSATVQPFHGVSFLEGIGNVAGANAAVLHARGVPSLGAMASRTEFTTAATGGKPGVTLETFANSDLSGAPTATKVDRSMTFGRPLDILTLMGSEEPVDFAAMMGVQAVPGMRWTGWYTPKIAGPQDVFVQQGGFGGSGARLFVDGKKVIDTWDQASAMVGQATVDLDATAHKVVLEYHSLPGGFGGPFVRAGIAPRGAWVDPNAVKLAAGADVAVVAIGFDAATESEGWDRTFGLPPGQDELVRQVAAANRNTVVVLTSGGAVDMMRWVDQVPAIVETWFPGQEGGSALGEILFGDVSPSGHLPATFERRWEDNPTFNSYYPKPGTLQVPYSEGVFVGYRGYEKNGTKPLFPFGHGLSYTTFSYANLSVAADAESTTEPSWTASFDVTNSGQRAGAAVAQVYVSDGHAKVARPAKELKGFAKVMLQPGEKRRVTVPLDLRSLAYYDVAGKQWKADAGTFTVRVGGSSIDLPLSAPLVLARTATHQ